MQSMLPGSSNASYTYQCLPTVQLDLVHWSESCICAWGCVVGDFEADALVFCMVHCPAYGLYLLIQQLAAGLRGADACDVITIWLHHALCYAEGSTCSQPAAVLAHCQVIVLQFSI